MDPARLTHRNWNWQGTRSDLGCRTHTKTPYHDRPYRKSRLPSLERSHPHVRLPRSTNLPSRRPSTRTMASKTGGPQTRSLRSPLELRQWPTSIGRKRQQAHGLGQARTNTHLQIQRPHGGSESHRLVSAPERPPGIRRRNRRSKNNLP